jgi:hypothetical protein
MKYQQPKHESGRIQAKRSLGQNLLTDKHKAQQIATLMDATEGDTIPEIGPGCGASRIFIEVQSECSCYRTR